MFAKKLLRFLKFSFLILIVLYALASCTVLQWRASDTEIKTKFKELNIPTQISYFMVDSLDLKIRLQQVGTNPNNLNLILFHGSPSSLSAWDGYLTDTSLLSLIHISEPTRPY